MVLRAKKDSPTTNLPNLIKAIEVKPKPSRNKSIPIRSSLVLLAREVV